MLRWNPSLSCSPFSTYLMTSTFNARQSTMHTCLHFDKPLHLPRYNFPIKQTASSFPSLRFFDSILTENFQQPSPTFPVPFRQFLKSRKFFETPRFRGEISFPILNNFKYSVTIFDLDVRSTKNTTYRCLFSRVNNAQSDATRSDQKVGELFPVVSVRIRLSTFFFSSYLGNISTPNKAKKIHSSEFRKVNNVVHVKDLSNHTEITSTNGLEGHLET